MADTGETLEETIDYLLEQCDPSSPNIKKLISLRDKIDRKVMLGLKSIKYLNSLMKKLDNIECDHLNPRGMCVRIRGMGNCNSVSDYAACDFYVPKKFGNIKDPMNFGG